MRYICIAQCEDCGPTLVVAQDQISIFKLGDEYTGVTMCAFCYRPIVSSMTPSFVEDLLKRHEVKILDWEKNE